MSGLLSSEQAAEQLRRVAARVTHEIVLRRGRSLGVWVGTGFPKSGTVWLCQLMSHYLDLPYPRNYQAPIAMASVIHSHWRYDNRLPPTVHVIRDGRDVMVSLYFHQMRLLSIPRNPRRTQQLRSTFRRLYGRAFDPAAVRENLPKFIEHEMTTRNTLRGMNWADYQLDWCDRPGVGEIRYEDLLADTAGQLNRVMVELDAPRQDPKFAKLAALRYDFHSASGRRPGDEDRLSFHRIGVAGEWKRYFTMEAAQAFQAHAGDVLTNLGYEKSRDWWRHL